MPLFGKFFSETQMKAAVQQYRLWSLMPGLPLNHVLATAGRAAVIETARNSEGGLLALIELSQQLAEDCDNHERQHGLKYQGTDGKGGWKGDDLVRTAHMYCLTQHWMYGSNNGADAPLYLTAERRGLLSEVGSIGSPRWDAVAAALLGVVGLFAQKANTSLDRLSVFKLRVAIIAKHADPDSPLPTFIRRDLSGAAIAGPSHCECGCSQALESVE